ncbi:MAG: alpha/beta hydrolase [Bacteroidales bacterium]|nr:alpha/beta hydrolase [Bacteroidales bacterium]
MKRLLFFIMVALMLASCASQRSFMASFSESVIRKSKEKQMPNISLSVLPKKISKRLKPELMLVTKNDCVMPVYCINKGADKCILYLHGGAYVEDITLFHWDFIAKIAKKTGAEIWVPIYPLAPAHTYRETFTLLEKTYDQILDSHRPSEVFFMGDSAGGGLAVALCEMLPGLSLPQPRSLILLSPWIDATMTNPNITQFADVDPMLNADGLMVAAQCWAGEDTEIAGGVPPEDSMLWDWHISPIYGEYSVLPRVELYAGTREILMPDILKFNTLLREAGVTSYLHIGHGCNHVYPLFPTPEAKEAIKRICSQINE